MAHNRFDGAITQAQGLSVLLAGEQSGATMLKDSKDVFILGHPEYARDTLDKEYKRDQASGLSTPKPVGYYAPNGEIMFQWRSSASVIFSNWLNLVYQDTPFLLKNHSQ
ncbi:homoserine O-succinyltransferase [uncultured Helicobacter sp.]|uniref:homoserine O-acetyltransferase/O-succinyltransferase family protein n=1 Tax=uncultured Helicobacter sp. TaxID=175537 RepID=UPI0029420B26|nr:homoserine O-succinyltransferase [uncultured Helicobacter sp.]